MAHDQRHQMIRRFLVWIGLLRAEDVRSDSKAVLAEARREIEASRRVREREMRLRVEVLRRDR